MINGIDISSFQQTVSFDKLKEEVDFVIIRSSYGVGYTDQYFAQNRDNARRVNLARGFYHYAYPEYNQPEDEADYFLSVIGTPERGELLCMDIEENFNGDKVDWSYRFLNRIKEKLGGYNPLIYINLSTANSSDWGQVIQGNFGLWIAFYDNDPTTMPATPWSVVAMKQYTNTLTLDGIEGNVDGDVFNGTLDLFYKYGYES